MMNDQNTIDVLNALLTAEQATLPVRLQESTVYVSADSVTDDQNVRDMVQASQTHSRNLVALLLRLGGAPAPRGGDLQSGDLHFQSLQSCIPRLIEDRDALIGKYAMAAELVSNEPRASRLIAQILQSHRSELALLQGAPEASN